MRERYRAERRRLGLPEEGLFYQGREGGVVSEEMFGEEVEAFDKELDEDERRAERDGEDAAGVMVGNGEAEVEALVRERPKEPIQADTVGDDGSAEVRGKDVDPGFMEEQERPKEERKGLFGRIWRR